MPVLYAIHKEIGLVVCHLRDTTEDNDMIAVYTAMYTDPSFDPAFAKLIDLRETDGRGRSSDALHALAGLVQSHYAGTDVKSKVAIIAPADLSFGLGRVYDGLTAESGEEVSVFRTATDAFD